MAVGLVELQAPKQSLTRGYAEPMRSRGEDRRLTRAPSTDEAVVRAAARSVAVPVVVVSLAVAGGGLSVAFAWVWWRATHPRTGHSSITVTLDVPDLVAGALLGAVFAVVCAGVAALLQVLASAPQTAFSRQHLLSAVFERGTAPGTVDTYIHYLRRKTDPALIETVRGVGYRLGTPV